MAKRAQLVMGHADSPSTSSGGDRNHTLLLLKFFWGAIRCRFRSVRRTVPGGGLGPEVIPLTSNSKFEVP